MRFKSILFVLLLLASVVAEAGNGFSIKTVVLDAGHGGKDPGAIGASKTNEKDIALKVVLKLGELIEKNFPDVNVIYTRKTDVFLELHERADIANQKKADLFMAVHCNSTSNPATYGTSTYVLGLHRTEANLEVAKRENAVILMEDDRDKNYDFDPNSPEGHIMMSMKQNAFLDQSIDIASKIESQYETGAKRKSLGVKQAGFYVIYKTTMPSLLSEIGFISNPDEEKFLNSAKGQDMIATSLFKAFKDYKFQIENSEGEQYAYEQARKKAEQDAANDTMHKPGYKKETAVTETTKETVVKKEEKTTSQSTTTSQPAPSDPSFVTLSGRRIRKPIENSSGGGTVTKPEETTKTTETSKTTTRTEDRSGTAVKPPVKETAKVEPVKESATDETSAVEPPVKEPVKETKTTKTETKTVTKTDTKTTSTSNGDNPPVKSAKTEPKTEAKKPAETAVKPAPAETKAVAKTEPVVKAKVPEPKTESAASAGNEGILFKVQFVALKGTFKGYDKASQQFPGLSKEELPNGVVRYYSYSAKTYAEAKKHLAETVSSGYPDAFIIGLKNGVRMTPDEMRAAQK